jgi:hypothetical protein
MLWKGAGKMQLTHRLTAAAVTLIVSASALLLPLSARASEEGRRNTALGLGAAAAYLLLTQKNKTAGIVAGLGAAYAYKRYNDSVRDRHRWDRYGYYDYDYRHDHRDRYDDRYRDEYDRDRRSDRYDRDRSDRDRRDRDDRYYSRRDRRDEGDDAYYVKSRRR